MKNKYVGGECLLFQAQLNFTYEIILPPDGKYGTVDENGVWNGMVKMTMENDIDAIICAMTVTASRLLRELKEWIKIF